MDGGIGEAALYSALVGGGTSAVMGGDPMKGALMGALTGGITSGIGGLMPGATPVPTPADSYVTAAAMPGAVDESAAETARLLQQNAAAAGTPIGTNLPTPTSPLQASSFSDFLKSGATLTPMQLALTGGGAGLGAAMQAERDRYRVPGQVPYTGPLSQFRYNPSFYDPRSSYLPMYRAAKGGIMDLHPDHMASGGISSLGDYSDGGRLLRGPGDGVSDDIPATIGNKQPARLADGEFVVPARIVSELGNGSTDAGAQQLYKMMDRVQSARGATMGKKKFAKDTKAKKYLPA